MSVKIEKYYDENVNLGNYCTARIGIKLSSSIECETPDDIKNTSDKLIKMAKILVKKDIEELKIEKGIKNKE